MNARTSARNALSASLKAGCIYPLGRLRTVPATSTSIRGMSIRAFLVEVELAYQTALDLAGSGAGQHHADLDPPGNLICRQGAAREGDHLLGVHLVPRPQFDRRRHALTPHRI